MQISGSVALVTGAASGLGEATARRLAERGATVVAVDMRPVELASVHPLLVDVTDSESLAAAVDRATQLGQLRIVVNCAGGGLMPTRTVSRAGAPQPLEPWRHIIELNLVAAYDLTRLAAAAMASTATPEDSERGVIVHTSSIAGLDGSIGMSSYASAKMALAAMTHSTARDLAIWGIRVLAIAPGAFDTPAYRGLPEKILAHRQEGFVFPKRPGRPDEFAAFAEHLIENEYLNAECYRIDAGLRLHE